MEIVLIGSGNVATQLGPALLQVGNRIIQVYSRTIENARNLAENVNAEPVNLLSQLSAEADMYIISVSDDAISTVLDQFPFRDKLLLHTSGTTSREVLDAASLKNGVFYPLQTFSKQRPATFKNIPIAVEASSKEVEELLLKLARSLSDNALVFDSQKRKALHVAAVFACNFTNHLYAIAQEILHDNQLDFGLLRPLIAETAAKVQKFFPKEVQTGPAVRNDQYIVAKHLTFFENKVRLHELYKRLSQDIINLHQKP